MIQRFPAIINGPPYGTSHDKYGQMTLFRNSSPSACFRSLDRRRVRLAHQWARLIQHWSVGRPWHIVYFGQVDDYDRNRRWNNEHLSGAKTDAVAASPRRSFTMAWELSGGGTKIPSREPFCDRIRHRIIRTK